MEIDQKKIRRYSELIRFDNFHDRLSYLQVFSKIGDESFGSSRYINQNFYRFNPYWKKVRREVILRDNGCDLGLEGFEISGGIYIHHLNPITITDIENLSEFALDPEYLICCSHKTHNAIHYGFDSEIKLEAFKPRVAGDTCPWR